MRLSRLVFALGVAVTALAVTGTVWKFQGRHPGGPTADGKTILANGWFLTPVGRHIALPGDMPGMICPIPGSSRALVNTAGYHNHSLNLVDTSNGSVLQSVDLNSAWIGMAFDPSTGDVYVSGGAAAGFKGHKRPGEILHYKVSGDGLIEQDPLKFGGGTHGRFVSGIALLKNHNLAVLDIQNDSLIVLKQSGEEVGRVAVGYRPYGVTESADSSKIAVSNWGDKSVTIVDANALKVLETISVGIHPNAIEYAPDGRLFVANGSSNSVSVIKDGRLSEVIRTSLSAGDPIGSAPVALAVTPDSRRLYVANADNNDVAVVDIQASEQAHVLGFIPTARYPSALAFGDQGRTLLIGSAKGTGPSANVGVPGPTQLPKDESRVPFVYVANLLQGNLAVVDLPDDKKLADYTKQVISNRPKGIDFISKADKATAMRAFKKIHHVIYIVKENRTYDQVLGDVTKGNGDPSLTMFGEGVTPNIHWIVNHFTLFDNLYTDGEVSQVGHQWTDAAYATDYNEKQWTVSYSGRQEVEADAQKLNSSPAGYLWDNAMSHGKTARIYGEYVKWQEDHNSAQGDVKKDPEKYGCSEKFEDVFARGGRDTEKVQVFIDEMHQAEKTGKWPNFMIMALNEDHTRGLSPGKHTPEAMVGSNDQAIGMLMDALSHSSFWKDTAVFVIEDDAQAGPDHVDAHRTESFIISPWVKRDFVDHTMYSTSSLIRTMEIILDLPPMTQYDAAATPQMRAFTDQPDFAPLDRLAPKIDLDAMNPSTGELAERSKKLDFSDDDRADPAEFNAILWKWRKPGQPKPPTVNGMLMAPLNQP
jgi:YVTN family beta-propeller protein